MGIQSLRNVAGFPLSGLTLITTATFSASSAVNVNNCFTSTYEFYVIKTRLAGAAATSLNVRLRVGGVDDTTASAYVRETLDGSAGTPASGTASQTSWIDLAYFGTTQSTLDINLYQPAAAASTAMNSFGGRSDLIRLATGHHTVTTAYDGFSLIPASSTITGTVRVYGYAN
jgi:hypothetical protein